MVGASTPEYNTLSAHLRPLASLEKVLNLNKPPQHNQDEHHDSHPAAGPIPTGTPILDTQGEPIWKVLVFDDMGKDVISSVLRVNDLRSWGVTMHLYASVPRPSLDTTDRRSEI